MLTAYTPGHFTQTKSKTKTQKQSSTDRSPIDTQKYTTLHSPAHYREKKTSLPPTRTQAQVTLNKKSTQTTQPTFPSKGKNQEEKEYKPKAWKKETSNLKQSKLGGKNEKTEIQHNETTNSQDQINKEEITNLHERAFRITIVKMI